MSDPKNISLAQLTNKKLLIKNSLWNFIGQLIPLTMAAISMPILIHRLGSVRFGILILAWTLIGYLGLLDFGIGSAMAQSISKKLGQNQIDEIPPTIGTALLAVGFSGFTGGLLAFLLAPMLVHHFYHASPAIQKELLLCLRIMALSLPLVIVSHVLSGALAAKQKFKLLNQIRIPLGTMNFLIPLIILNFTTHVYWIVGFLACSRLIGFFLYIYSCFKEYQVQFKHLKIQWDYLKSLIVFGGWVTITSLVSPILVTFDRFIIGSFISIAAIAYYSTPYELANKIQIFSSPLIQVLFPALASSYQTTSDKTTLLLKENTKIVFFLLFPITLTVVCFARLFLSLWLGNTFAAHSEKVLQLIVIGVTFNILAQFFYILIQGAGRPDLTAKNHLAEIPFYLIVLFLFIHWFGITGVAWAWIIRVILDLGLLAWQSYHIILKRMIFSVPVFSWMTGSLIFLLGTTFLHLSLITHLILYMILLIVFLNISWLKFLDSSEKTLLKKFFIQFILRKNFSTSHHL
jgi:O-antigen/teichoic acid export membrane protein